MHHLEHLRGVVTITTLIKIIGSLERSHLLQEKLVIRQFHPQRLYQHPTVVNRR